MFADPQKIIPQILIAEGMSVAEFGAGSGFYTLPMAKRVGPYGKVYAIDILTEYLSKIRREADRQGLINIALIHADLEKPGASALQQASVDRVLITNILFQVAEVEPVLAEAKRVLKPRGKVAIVEWMDSYDYTGPHPDQIVTRDQVIALMLELGFRAEKDIDAGSHHYGVLFSLE